MGKTNRDLGKFDEANASDLHDVANQTSDNVFKKGNRINLVSGAAYWDFKDHPKFTGKFLHDVIGKDPQDPTKTKVIAYAFVDSDGIEWAITAAYAVAKALETQIEGIRVKDMEVLLEITWLEKIEREGKPDYNRFNIDIID